jgi:hypothetical protein
MSALLASIGVLAHVPFLEPAPWAHRYWWLLLVPLAWGISMTWKAVRLDTLEGYWRRVTILTLQILGGCVGIAVGLFVIVQWVLPRLPAN